MVRAITISALTTLRSSSMERGPKEYFLSLVDEHNDSYPPRKQPIGPEHAPAGERTSRLDTLSAFLCEAATQLVIDQRDLLLACCPPSSSPYADLPIEIFAVYHVASLLVSTPPRLETCLTHLPSTVLAKAFRLMTPASIDLLYLNTGGEGRLVRLAQPPQIAQHFPETFNELAVILDRPLASFPSDWLPSIAEIAQLELDMNEDVSIRRKCIRMLQELAQQEILPPSFVLDGIALDSADPVSGGTFADVYKTSYNGRVLGVKCLRVIMCEESNRKQIIKDFAHEAIVWKQLKHPNVHLFGGVVASFDPAQPLLWLVSDWMESGTIISYLKVNPNHNRLQSLLQIAAGLKYLHTFHPQIVHRDLKGSNILVNNDGVCRLADFGISKIVETQKFGQTSIATQNEGTARWMAPELIDASRSREYRQWPTAVDIYSFACVALEIYTLKVPFHEITDNIAVVFAVAQGERPSQPPEISEELWELVSRCWADEAAKRPEADEIIIYLGGMRHLPPPPELSVVHLNSELVRSTSSDQGAEAEAHNVFTISIPLYGGGNITSIEIML